jgi:hypothetical protein
MIPEASPEPEIMGIDQHDAYPKLFITAGQADPSHLESFAKSAVIIGVFLMNASE